MPIPNSDRFGGPLPDGGSPDPAADHNLLALAAIATHWDIATFSDADTTGVTDTADALNAAHDELDTRGGGVLYAPPGFYALDSTVVIGRGTGLVGAGNGVTVFVRRTSAAGIAFGGGAESSGQAPPSGGFDVVDEDSLDDPLYFGDLGGTCVSFGRFALRKFQSIHAIGGDYGLAVTSSQNTRFSDMYASRSAVGLLTIDGGAQDIVFDKLNLSKPGPGAYKCRVSGRVPHLGNPHRTYPNFIRFRSGILEREGADSGEEAGSGDTATLDDAPAMIVEAGDNIIIDDISFNDSIVGLKIGRAQHYSTDPDSPYYDPGDVHFGDWLPTSVALRAGSVNSRGPYGIDIVGTPDANDAAELYIADLTKFRLEDISGIRGDENTRIRINSHRLAASCPVLWQGTIQGTAQAGGASTITLEAGSSAVNDYYPPGGYVSLERGTGAGQYGEILAYNGTTKVLTIVGTWTVTPDNTTVYNVDDPAVRAADRVRPVNGTYTVLIDDDFAMTGATPAAVPGAHLETWGSGKRIVDLELPYSGPAGTDIVIGFTMTGGGDFHWSAAGLAAGETSVTGAPNIPTRLGIADDATLGTAGTGVILVARIRGELVGSAAHGTVLALQISQGTPDAADTTVYADGLILDARDVPYTVKQAT